MSASSATGATRLRIPREFEIDGDEAILHKEGDRLIIEPVRRGKLLAMLATLEPLPEDFSVTPHPLVVPGLTRDLQPWNCLMHPGRKEAAGAPHHSHALPR